MPLVKCEWCGTDFDNAMPCGCLDQTERTVLIRARAELRREVERLRAAIATHRQEQGEAVTKSAADAADRRLWKFLAAATQAGV